MPTLGSPRQRQSPGGLNMGCTWWTLAGPQPWGPQPRAGPGRWLSTPGTGRLGGQVLRDLMTLDTLSVVTVTSLVQEVKTAEKHTE